MRLTSIFSQRGGTKNEPKSVAVGSTVSEYLKKSTIHGVTYVGDDERNKFERIWWFVMLVCSIFGACYLIYQAYRTMNENPIIESPALSKTPLWGIPFPAVTICPAITKKLTLFALNKTYWPKFAHKFLPENLTDLPHSSQISPSIFIQNVLLQRSDQDNYKILTQGLPEIKFKNAKWRTHTAEGHDVPAQKTITSIGACVTFNMYDEKDLLRDGVILSTLDNLPDKKKQLWNRDSGFTKGLPAKDYTYPFRAFTTEHSFSIRFNATQSGQISRFNSEFILIYFHAPDELPLVNPHAVSTIISAEKHNSIKLTPKLVVSERIEKYEPNVRQCYYGHERHLKYYKTYTQSHCESECLADYTLDQCGCVPYFMPHFNDTQICGADFNCYLNAVDKLFLPVFKDNATHAPIDDCNCLQTCTQLSYTIEVVEAKARRFYESYVLIGNKRPFFTKNIRTELHSLSEFFCNCGGSLGLFLGVSILSIVELLYFCTIRLYLQSKKRTADSTE